MFFYVSVRKVDRDGDGREHTLFSLFYKSTLFCYYDQCWGKLLLKVMHYNIALLPKKVTNYVT